MAGLAPLTLENRSNARQYVYDAGLSLLFACAFFLVWPTDLIFDDGAIVLRYIENFARGHFFAYNPEDGPLFGVSGFLHGLVSGGLAYFRLFAPLNAMLASNCLGLICVSFLSLQLLRRYAPQHPLRLAAWLILMLAAPRFIISVKQGIETPLHVAFILLNVVAFLSNYPRCFALTATVAVISKLDAAPIVAVLAALFAIKKSALGRREGTAFLFDLLLFGAVPGLLWLGFTWSVFGGPFPQAVEAKLYFHEHPSDRPLPFLFAWLHDMKLPVLLTAMLTCLYAARVCYRDFWNALRRCRASVPELFWPSLCLVAYFALYLYYNPVEQMSWYYALPDFLLVFQALILCLIIPSLSRERPPKAIRWATPPLLLLGVAAAFAPRVIALTQDALEWIRLVEPERIAMGEWVRNHARPGEVLFAGHGHVAAQNMDLYVVDYSGLNSRIVTDYRLDFDRLVRDLKPDWIVKHGLLPVSLALSERYVLRESSYNIAARAQWPAWRIYQRESSPGSSLEVFEPIPASRLRASRVTAVNGGVVAEGNIIRMENLFEFEKPTGIRMGIDRSDLEQAIIIRMVDTNGQLLNEYEIRVEPARFQQLVWEHTAIFPLAGTVDELVVFPSEDKDRAGNQVRVVEPSVLRLVDLP